MKRLMFVVVTGALLGGAFVDNSYAGDKGRGHKRAAVSRYDASHDRDHHSDRNGWNDRTSRGRDYRIDDRRVERGYVGSRDVVVVRNYYRPHYHPAHGVRRVYVRHGYLPHGWERRIVAVPVYVARDLQPLPYGYARGIIDGHLVVHNHGLIVDVAVLF